MPQLAALGAHENTRNLIPQPSQILTVFTRDGNALDITLDGGATGSFIKQSCAIKHNFKIWPNNQSAGLADSKTCVKSIGYIEETFYRDSWAVKFKGLVVQNLKADIYGGQPFMIENDIIQRPAKKNNHCSRKTYGHADQYRASKQKSQLSSASYPGQTQPEKIGIISWPIHYSQPPKQPA